MFYTSKILRYWKSFIPWKYEKNTKQFTVSTAPGKLRSKQNILETFLRSRKLLNNGVFEDSIFSFQSSLLVSSLSQHPSLWRSPHRPGQRWSSITDITHEAEATRLLYLLWARFHSLGGQKCWTGHETLPHLNDTTFLLKWWGVARDKFKRSLKGWVQRKKDVQPKPSFCCKGGPELLSVSDKIVLKSCA